jgi:hypothetical protein
LNYKADTPVKVFNHSISSINLPGQFREYYLEGSRGVPTVLTMPFSDVEYINSRTPVFRNGRVQFDEKERDDIYHALYLDNWKDTVLFDEEIDRIIRENDMDAAARFVKIADVAEIHRVRSHMVALQNDDGAEISNRMIDIINQRYDEINRGVRNSEINLGKAKERAKQDEDPRITAMMEQMAALQAQLAAMQTASQTATAPAPKKQTTRKKAAPAAKTDAE